MANGALTRLHYDHVVIACGAESNLGIIPGMTDHAFAFKVMRDAILLRQQIVRQMESAEATTDPDLRRWHLRFIIVGAGFSGVEVAGEINEAFDIDEPNTAPSESKSSDHKKDGVMRILVVGAGAVGGYFGGRLGQAGRDVTFLVRPHRAETIRAGGLQVVSPHGDFTVYPNTITTTEIAFTYDVILLSVKSFALLSAIDDFAAAIGPQTVIVPVLNGMRHMDLLMERFGKHAVLGGVCVVATEMDPQGRIVQLADFQSLRYGELEGQKTERVEAVDQAFRGAGFDAAISTQILQDMWQKWVQLASWGAITCLLRGNIGEIVAVPGGAELSLTALSECAAVAAACGNPPSTKFLKENGAQLTTAGTLLTSSMYRDLLRNAPVEVDTILGDLLDYGRKLGISTPILQAAVVNLSIYQRARKIDRSESANSITESARRQ